VPSAQSAGGEAQARWRTIRNASASRETRLGAKEDGVSQAELNDYGNQPDLPTGWAVRINGAISIRTASYRPEAAKINSLVLHGGIDSWATSHMSDLEINARFAELTRQLGLELVEVECVPAHPQSSTERE
jgi:hypothetical protein